MASANTQKTDPVMEPKLKAVDWDKVSGHGTGRGGDWGSWGQGWRLRAVAVHDEGDEGPGGRCRQLPSLAWGNKLGPKCWWVPGNQMQGLAAKTPEGGPPQGSLKLRRGRHPQLDQCRGRAATGRRQDAGWGGSRLHQVGAEPSHSPLSALGDQHPAVVRRSHVLVWGSWRGWVVAGGSGAETCGVALPGAQEGSRLGACPSSLFRGTCPLSCCHLLPE